MMKRSLLTGGLLTAISLSQAAFAQSDLSGSSRDIPLTNTTIFLLFVIVVIIGVLVLKYANKPTDVEKVRKEIEVEEEEKKFI